jgi:type IV pilus assembly protein PilB
MENQPEHQQLEHYASATNTKILENQADLDPKDRAMPEMLTWCREQQHIVVLQSGNILTCYPTSRLLQNCKIVMSNRGLIPGQVYPAASALIRMLLENAEEKNSAEDKTPITVSSQQQRLRLLVKEALELEASDIHLEVRQDIARIRFRKHGELFLHAEWLPKLGREIASVAFNKETDHAVSHFNPLIPQNASMPLTIDNQEIRLRLASLPAHQGFDVTMRILTTGDDKVESLESLGYLPEQIRLIKKAVQMPYGAIIMAGPTGSGKTTTLASCMRLVTSPRKIFTVEDPVEKLVPNATQVPINTDHYDRGFANMTRTVLRMDPDVIVLGEIRDEDTAHIMARAAITGHLVFSTVHTNTATDIITRLVDLGISRTLLASPNLLVCLMCQRLAPLLCQSCAVPLKNAMPNADQLPYWQKIFGNDFQQLKVRGRCQHCHQLGIRGRTVIAEVIWLDETGRQYIQNGDILGWQAYLKSQGFISYREHLLTLVKNGHCDPYDAEKLIGDIYMQHNLKNFSYFDA